MTEKALQKLQSNWKRAEDMLGTEMMEIETIKGRKVMIPKKLSLYWENIKMLIDAIIEDGEDPRECLENDTISPHVITLGEIYLEIFKEND